MTGNSTNKSAVKGRPQYKLQPRKKPKDWLQSPSVLFYTMTQTRNILSMMTIMKTHLTITIFKTYYNPLEDEGSNSGLMQRGVAKVGQTK